MIVHLKSMCVLFQINISSVHVSGCTTRITSVDSGSAIVADLSTCVSVGARPSTMHLAGVQLALLAASTFTWYGLTLKTASDTCVDIAGSSDRNCSYSTCSDCIIIINYCRIIRNIQNQSRTVSSFRETSQIQDRNNLTVGPRCVLNTPVGSDQLIRPGECKWKYFFCTKIWFYV